MAEWGKRLARRLPTRETIENNRLLRPFARHLDRHDLWHLNHRSMPRGVALGLGIGILVPFLHIVLVAIIAIPARANILLAAAVTMAINPLTMPPLYYTAYRIGSWQLHDPSLAAIPVAAGSGQVGDIFLWLDHAWEPIALGLATMALFAAGLGYAVAAIGWRLWTRAKARKRATGEI